MTRKRATLCRRAGAVAVAGAISVLCLSAPAWADSASDSRATFVGGNVTSCGQIGFSSDIQVGSTSNASASDSNVAGTVSINESSIDHGIGQELDVTITGSDIVIDAIVVKGGSGYNKYTSSTVLPPTLASPQRYIAPLVGTGNVPMISHWFVCYHSSTEVPIGAIGGVGLAVVAGAGFLIIQRRRRNPAAHLDAA